MTRIRTAGSRTFLSLRRHRNYRLFFAGQITSVCGTWMQNVALYWLILSLTHSPLAVGILSLARFGPFTAARALRRRRRRPVRQPAHGDRHPVGADGLLGPARRDHPARHGAALAGLRDRGAHGHRGRVRSSRPPEPDDAARRPRRAPECDRAQLEPLQHGADPRAGASPGSCSRPPVPAGASRSTA